MDCAPHVLELPLHLGVMTFGAVMMGLSGHDIRLFHMLRSNLAGSGAAGVFYIEDNGIRMVDLALLVIGAITFVWAIICIALSAKQFKGRKGNYTGEGTAAWLPVSLIYMLILGAWTGITSAYTAYANTRTWSLSPGPNYRAPFTEGQQYALYQIGQSFYNSNANPISTPDSFLALGVPAEALAPWSSVTTIEQANAETLRYLRYQVYKATVICAWMTLAMVFTATVAHIAFPFLLRCLGWTREDKRRKEARELESKEYA